MSKTMTPKRLPDPLAKLRYSGNAEKDSIGEQNAMMDAFNEATVNAVAASPHPEAGKFKAKEARENERRRAVLQCGYYVTLVFQSNEQKAAFVKGAGWSDTNETIVDGRVVAQKLGVPIPEERVRFSGEKCEPATINFEPIEPLPGKVLGKGR